MENIFSPPKGDWVLVCGAKGHTFLEKFGFSCCNHFVLSLPIHPLDLDCHGLILLLPHIAVLTSESHDTESCNYMQN